MALVGRYVMKAIQMTAFGRSENLTLADCERPKPGENQYLVKVRAASVNPIDWKLRSGALRPLMWPSLPVVLGFYICGDIVEAGPGATKLRVGDTVYARLATRFG